MFLQERQSEFHEGLDPNPDWCVGIVLRPAQGGEMRVPDDALMCVVYIGFKTDAGNFVPKGTGFIGAAQRNGGIYFYLITADHVRRGLPSDRNFAIRLNDKQGKVATIPNPTGSKWLKWWKHPTDTTVDAAIYPWTMFDFNFAAFPFNRFVTEAETRPSERASDPGIGIGDEIFIVGLFRKFAGRDRITPIVRSGNIAMMDPEPITTKYGESEFHLVEAFTTAGLSGSPVFVNETVFFQYQPISRPRAYAQRTNLVFTVAGAHGPSHLLGLVHGMMPIETFVELNDRSIDPKQKWNSGIAMVVPSAKILEIVSQPKLIECERESGQPLNTKTNDRSIETALPDEPQDNRQKTRPKKGDAIDIPIPSREQFEKDLGKAVRRKPRG